MARSHACSTVAHSITSSQPRLAAAAGELARRHAARRRRGAGEHDVELVGAQRRQHLGRVAALQAADDQDALAGRVEVFEEHLRDDVSAPAGLCAPSTITSG